MSGVTWTAGAQAGETLGGGQHQQQAGGGDLVQEQPEQLQGGRVGPVQVFPYGQHRVLRGFCQQPGDQRFLRLLLLALRTQGQRRIPLWDGQRQQGGHQRYHLRQGQARRLYCLLQRGQSGLRRLLAVPVQQPLEVLNDRIEGTVGVIGGTAQRQPWRSLVHHTLGEHTHQARFANARLAAEQHHLAQPVAGSAPSAPAAASLPPRGPPAG